MLREVADGKSNAGRAPPSGPALVLALDCFLFLGGEEGGGMHAARAGAGEAARGSRAEGSRGASRRGRGTASRSGLQKRVNGEHGAGASGLAVRQRLACARAARGRQTEPQAAPSPARQPERRACQEAAPASSRASRTFVRLWKLRLNGALELHLDIIGHGDPPKVQPCRIASWLCQPAAPRKKTISVANGPAISLQERHRRRPIAPRS